MDLLSVVSGFLEITDPRGQDPFAQDDATPTLADLVESLITTSYAETTAALTALYALIDDELMAARIGRELATRRHPMPPWLQGLTLAKIDPDVWFLTHVLGDGDDYLLGATLPSGHSLAALVYVDHNMGTVVKDAFVIPEELQDLALSVGANLEDPDQSLARIDPAAARAAIEQAIEDGAHIYPPLESEGWPMCRPLVEWMVRMLPTGGTAPQRPEWSDQEQAALQQDFFNSPFGAELDDPDHHSLVESLIWFGTDYSSGNPLRWSPVVVEILLLDWLPRKVVADPTYLAKAPDLLRAFVRYSHQKQVIRAEHTTATLAAIDMYEPQYSTLIRSDSTRDRRAIFDQVTGAYAQDELGVFEVPDISGLMLHRMEHVVGGQQALMDLSADPLPDEPFDWDGIPQDIHPRVAEMLAACDRCCDELLDAEHRTAMRRFLHRAAVGDPEVFRRKAAVDRGAAAVAWAICRANESAGWPPGPSIRELLAFFGVKGSVSQRAEPMLRAIGIGQPSAYEMALGTPDLLTAKRRAVLVAARDQYLQG